MDLNRVSDAEKLSLCKRYFIGGFFVLPLLWLVNFIWFFRHAFMRPEFGEQKRIRFYVSGSLCGFLIYMIPIIFWANYYQQNRVSMKGIGESLAFIIPAGKP